jgi:hypothetical protein
MHMETPGSGVTRFDYRAKEVNLSLQGRGQTHYPLAPDVGAEIHKAAPDFYLADLYVGGYRVESEDRASLAALLEWVHEAARKYR